MTTTTTHATSPPKPLDAAVQWWTNFTPNTEVLLNDPWQLFWRTSLESQRILGEAMTHEFEILRSAQESVNHTCQSMLSSRRPQDLRVAQSAFIATFFEMASAQAKAAAESADKLRHCYSNASHSAKVGHRS